jgi:hypothetical protein
MELSEVDKMCIQHDHKIETMEIETRLLELFLFYENCIKSELSEREWKDISSETLLNIFFCYAREQLPILLDREERGEKCA